MATATLASYQSGKITTNTLVNGALNAPTTIALVSGKDYKTVTGISTLANGATIGDTDLYGKFTYKGDAKLDGKITADGTGFVGAAVGRGGGVVARQEAPLNVRRLHR